MELTAEKIVISVIIPTYKPDKNNLIECINSLVKQSLKYSLFEVIIILNGSDDSFRQLVNEILQDSKLNYKIFICSLANVSNARNIGLNNKVGEYVCFLDDDDFVSDNYLENLLEIAEKDSIIVSNVTCYNDETCEMIPDYITKSFANCYNREVSFFAKRKFLSSACCKLIPSQIISYRRFNVKYVISEDALFMALISDKIRDIKLANFDTFYYRRIRTGSASRSLNVKSRLVNILRLQLEFIIMYLSNPLRYNPLFFASRIIALFKSIK